jgi:hypothetical protein
LKFIWPCTEAANVFASTAIDAPRRSGAGVGVAHQTGVVLTRSGIGICALNGANSKAASSPLPPAGSADLRGILTPRIAAHSRQADAVLHGTPAFR